MIQDRNSRPEGGNRWAGRMGNVEETVEAGQTRQAALKLGPPRPTENQKDG